MGFFFSKINRLGRWGETKNTGRLGGGWRRMEEWALAGVCGVGDRREGRMCTRAISAQKINNSTPRCVRKTLNV